MALPTWKKALFALTASAALLGLIELALLVAGVRPLTERGDPYVGFAGNAPLFVDRNGSRMETAANKLRFFNAQTFPAHKSEGVYRIFCLGGSTTYGRPYDDATSFCGWLRVLLPRVDPGREWEVVNAGGVSYASHRIARLAEELAAYDPDLFIVYTGHNEFLERRTYSDVFAQPAALREANALLARTRIYSALARLRPSVGSDEAPERELLPAEVTTLLDSSVGPEAYERDPELRSQAIEHFRHNLERIVDLAETARADSLLVVPAANLAACTPFKSERGDDLSDAQIAEWERLSGQAARARAAGDAAALLAAVEAMAAIDPAHADTQFLHGRLLAAADRHDEAARAFERARDEDVCPLRAPSELLESVREVARDRDLPLVDFDRVLRGAVPGGVPGAESFLDHVHPTIEGHRLLALEIVAAMRSAGWLEPQPGWGPDAVAEATAEIEGGIDAARHAGALRNLAKVLGWAGKGGEALRLALEAVRLNPRDAEAQYTLGLLLLRSGRADDAEAALGAAIALRPGFADAHYDLALLRHSRGEREAAERGYRRAIELREAFAPAHNNLGVLLENRGELDAARAAFERAVQVDPELADARHNLGRLLARRGELEAALRELSAAVERRPDAADFHYSLATVLERLGRGDEARARFERVLELDPTDADARRALARPG